MNIVVALGLIITFATGVPVMMQILKNHPRGLIILFFAEMWERFSYYGMRGILIFFLTQHFLFDDAMAGSTYGSYTSLVYLLPLLGGIMADRFIGTRKAVAFGALLLVAGHGMMAFEGRPATETLTYAGQTYQIDAEGRGAARDVAIVVDGQKYKFEPAENGLAIQGLPATSTLPAVIPTADYKIETTRDMAGVNVFYLAVSLIIMGVGFLKPNISTIVGQLYPQGDPRRDSGFTLYYYGINLGAFWAAVLCGLLGQTVGWWAGFGLAGVGMALGWVVFMLGKPLLQGKGEPPAEADLEKARAGSDQPRMVDLSGQHPGRRRRLVHGSAQRPGGLGAGRRDRRLAAVHPLRHRQGLREQGAARADDAGPGADLRLGGLLHPVRTGRHLAEPVRRP